MKAVMKHCGLHLLLVYWICLCEVPNKYFVNTAAITGVNNTEQLKQAKRFQTPKFAAPRVIHPHRVVFAEEGDPINLPCHYQGYPEPNVTWFINGQRMISSTRNITLIDFNNKEVIVRKVSFPLSNGSWHISNVEEDDDGNIYTCVVTNSYGNATGEVTLLVREEPVPIEFDIRLTSEEFEDALADKKSPLFEKLAEKVTTAIKSLFKDAGNITIISIDVSRFRKGSVIAEVRMLALSRIADDKDLVIAGVSNGLGAIFTNSTHGMLGTMRVESLVLHEPPPPPRDLRADVIEETTITVSWSPPKNHQIYAISNYTVFCRTFGSEKKKMVLITAPHEMKAKITGLEKQTAYQIEIVVSNKYGYGTSKLLEVKTQSRGGKSLFDSVVFIVLVSLASCLVFLCFLCVLLLICRIRAAKNNQENLSFNMEQLDSSTAASLPDSPHFYANVNLANETSQEMLPMRYLHGESTNWREISRDVVKFQEHLGEGSFCEVKKALLVKNDRTLPCAIKMLKQCSTEVELRDLANELNVMANVGDHPNVISLYGACTAGGPLWLVVKLAENGTLLDYLHLHRTNKDSVENQSPDVDLSYDEKLGLAFGIAKGMRHLARVKCVHRDLACRNVLLGKGNIPKISDFGLSRDIYESGRYEYTEEARLPTRWMAVESLLDYSFSEKSDVWSFGVVLWEIETAGRVPFPAMVGMEILEQLLCGYRLPKPAGCSDEIYEMMSKCWQRDPNKRPNFHELVKALDELLFSSEATASYCHDDDLDENAATFFENLPVMSSNDISTEKDHTYVNLGVETKTYCSTDKGPTTHDIVSPKKLYRSRSLDRVKNIYNTSENVTRCGSLDSFIIIHNLPDEPPAVPSYDRLLSLHDSPKTTPKTSPKPPSYDRLLGFHGSASSSRRSSIGQDAPSRSNPEEIKEGTETEQACYDRLQHWVDGIPSFDYVKETCGNPCSSKAFIFQTKDEQSLLQNRNSCQLAPHIHQENTNDQQHSDRCLGPSSNELGNAAIERNDFSEDKVDQLHSSSVPTEKQVGKHDEQSLDNSPENGNIKTCDYKLSSSFETESSCYDSLNLQMHSTESMSCFKHQHLIPDSSFHDTSKALYSRIRDSGIECDDHYCEINFCHSKLDKNETHESTGLYDTITNHLGFSGEVECVDENEPENIYATINIYDFPSEIQEILLGSEETQAKVTNAITSDSQERDCLNSVNDTFSTTESGEHDGDCKTKVKVRMIPYTLDRNSLIQNNGELIKEETNASSIGEKETLDQEQSNSGETATCLYDEILEILNKTKTIE